MVDNLTTKETALLIPRTGVPSGPRDHRQSYQKRLAVYLILASTTLESIAFYSLTITLFIILQNNEKFYWDDSHRISLSFIFSGTCYVSTIIFAALSDGKFGRAKTIIIGFCLYLIGYILIVLIIHDKSRPSICGHEPSVNSTMPPESTMNYCYPAIYGILLFTAIGIGGIQGNLLVFGAEQTQKSYEKSRYFDKYIIATNSAFTICVALVSYLDRDGESSQYFSVYLFAILSLLTAFVIFLAGYRCYIYVQPDETIVTKIFPVLINAIHIWWTHRHNNAVVLKMHKSPSSAYALVETSDEDNDNSIAIRRRISSILDYARQVNKGKYIDRIVNDIKTLRRIILVFFIIIPYGLTAYQTQTTFLLQSQYMEKPNISVNSSEPYSEPQEAIWMILFDPAGTLLSLLLLRMFAYKYFNEKNKPISIHFKFIFGMIIASIAMIIAGIVEVFRQKSCHNDHKSISVFSQLPQYFLMGIAELFFTLASLEFAYLAAPRSASSLVMSLRYCSLGFSSFLGYAYMKIYTPEGSEFEYTCKEPYGYQHELYTYFYVLAVIPLLTALILYLCNRKYQILRLHPYKTDKRPFL